jgi:hypothetical protein
MLDDATRHMTSFVFDIVRAHVPKIKLAYLFEEKDELADIVKSELAQVMEGFGFRILKALVTDIEMDARVKESMIAASARKSDILISRSPDELDSLSEQMRNDWIEGDQTAGATEQGRGALPELKTGPQGFHVPEGPEHPTAPNPHGNGAQFMPQGRKIIVDDRVISWLVRRNS